MHQQNGKESVGSSFAKFTAHWFKRILQLSNPDLLNDFISTKRDRNYQFWKRDPLAIPLSTLSIFEQKLAYIHNNPIQEKWKLSNSPEEYRWSSVQFYKTVYDEFNFLAKFMGIEVFRSVRTPADRGKGLLLHKSVIGSVKNYK
jgi:hypothetical protein